MAHTPGPWETDEAEHEMPYQNIEIRQKGRKRRIAQVSLDDAPVPDFNAEQVANARLMVAAPDLYGIVRRWAAIDGGAWAVERHARERAELLNDTLLLIDRIEGRS